jgi:hypothetical protein
MSTGNLFSNTCKLLLFLKAIFHMHNVFNYIEYVVTYDFQRW